MPIVHERTVKLLERSCEDLSSFIGRYAASMRGAVAAGHPLTAEAGARTLAEGGNAVDACVAAGFASWVCESPLTGPGGGGFMLVHTARDRRSRVLDFFVAAPGLGLAGGAPTEMDEVVVDFAGGATQVFHIGPPSCAVPGAVAGLEAAHRAFGRLPWRAVVEPALELAREGVELTRTQAALHAILDRILRHTPEARHVYGETAALAAGERIVLRDLASTLELLAEQGAHALYRGEFGRALVTHLEGDGGVITAEDLAAYRVVWRRPVCARYGGSDLVSNPPPSSGGVLIAYGLQLLERLPVAPAGSADALAAIVEVMREQTRARSGSFATHLHHGGLAQRLEADLDAAYARVLARLPAPAELAPAGTTHISVVDGAGNAASLSASTGSGSGVVVPGTGIYMNNMLGEPDLTDGRPPRPGRRLTSMMAPTIALGDSGPRLVVGSAGSARLRGAIMQIVVNVLGHGHGVEEAIETPRVHVDGEHVHCEGGLDPRELDRLESRGYELVRWSDRNLFFGGAAAVEVRPDGELRAAGDPRRGGHGIVVE
jgi:gamma-glutamyltranspeptidase / glutathione hydrolase